MDRNTPISQLLEEYRASEMLFGDWPVALNMLITRIENKFHAYYNWQHRNLGLKHNAILILFTLIQSKGEMSQKQLAKRIPLTKQAVAASLKSLELQGLLTRDTHTRDRRRLRVRLSEKGVVALKKSLPLRRDFYSKFVKCISKEEATNVMSMLQKIDSFYTNIMRNSRKRDTE